MGSEAFSRYNSRYNPVKEEIDTATEKETKNGKWESREDKLTLFLKFRPVKICVSQMIFLTSCSRHKLSINNTLPWYQQKLTFHTGEAVQGSQSRAVKRKGFIHMK